MKSGNALRVLAEITVHQWGMVTSAQAAIHGITRLTLSRLTEAGHLERLAHGVYKVSGTPSDQFEDLRIAWLSTEPKATGESRLQEREAGVVVAGASAARLHEIGDLWPGRHEFVSPKRRQSQRAEIRYRQRTLEPSDVTLVQGLPTMTIERTIADLVEEIADLSLVGDALRDAASKRNLDFDRLRELLIPLAARNGFRRQDRDGLLNRLLEIAQLDAETVAHHIAADPELGSRVAARYLDSLDIPDLEWLVMTPEIRESMQATSDAITRATQTTGKSLTAKWTPKPETLAAIHAVQKASAHDRT